MGMSPFSVSSLADHHQPISVTSTPAAVSATLRPSPYKTHMSVSGTEKSISLQGSQA